MSGHKNQRALQFLTTRLYAHSVQRRIVLVLFVIQEYQLINFFSFHSQRKPCPEWNRKENCEAARSTDDTNSAKLL